MKNLLFCFTLLCLMHTASFAQSIVGTYDAKSGAVTLTADAQKVRAEFTRLLNDPKASVDEVYIWKSEDASHFVLTGRVTNSSRNINLIGWTLKNDNGKLDSGPGFELTCEGTPCSTCSWGIQWSTWDLKCVCKELNCSTCRCNMIVKISVGVNFN